MRSHQRERIFEGLESAMGAKGYGDTSVADIIKVAAVSRQTFYELFTSKQDCFLASYGRRQGAVIEAMLDAPANGPAIRRFGALLRNYLSVMSADPGLSRLYLVGVYTAGPEAMAKRLELQQQFVDGVATIFDARSDQDLFMCRALVASISTMVTNALIEDDPQAVLDLYEPLVEMAKRLM
ncbi:TetR/AcrR family transcriptional regulator [Mycolicibacterium lacusdiani]|uniref:TetR/AcrR family transcriptional regulator n=1 Tax=Mycolicibacterium lacusdiani TaxID=2895283 RepID=UPI001F37D66B|nr:TetR/AcrR family transcriptional regulator [Mycolicibacterium lacusdiani]